MPDSDGLRFDGRVAVITGAGRGIGRAYALLLAAAGAQVVVNDLGGSSSGRGADSGPAQSVAEEIVAAGGTAIADTGDIATAQGGESLIEVAVERFGRIDILINNAGIMRWGQLPDLVADDIERHLDVHLLGSFHTTRAAWPHFVAQRFGRIVMTASAGIFGLANNTAYAAAKGGVVGLARSLALTGVSHGIAVNVIAPAAITRMAGRRGEDDGPAMSPDLVAPMVAYLAHERCPVNGEIYAAGGGRFSRIFIASTPGYLHAGPTPSIGDIAEHWAAINGEAGYCVPTDLIDWSAQFTSHLPTLNG